MNSGVMPGGGDAVVIDLVYRLTGARRGVGDRGLGTRHGWEGKGGGQVSWRR